MACHARYARLGLSSMLQSCLAATARPHEQVASSTSQLYLLFNSTKLALGTHQVEPVPASFGCVIVSDSAGSLICCLNLRYSMWAGTSRKPLQAVQEEAENVVSRVLAAQAGKTLLHGQPTPYCRMHQITNARADAVQTCFSCPVRKFYGSLSLQLK